MMANGMLAGLVAITAPCAFVQPWAAAVIGIIAGVIVVESVWFFEKRGVDDPVGAISVHGVCGAWGVLAVGHLRRRLATAPAGTAAGADDAKGVTGHPLRRQTAAGSSLAQAMGVLTIAIVMGGIAYLFFYIQNKVMKGGIRPTPRGRAPGRRHSRDGRARVPRASTARTRTSRCPITTG